MKDQKKKSERKEKKDPKKEKKPARLKTQKGSLGKSQGQKKKKKKKIEACQAENPKGRSRQKLGVKSQQIENLKMQSEKEKDFTR